MEMEKATLEEKTWSNTFKLQFKVKLELKRGNGSLVHFSFPAFNFQFKVKLEVKRHFQLFLSFHDFGV